MYKFIIILVFTLNCYIFSQCNLIEEHGVIHSEIFAGESAHYLNLSTMLVKMDGHYYLHFKIYEKPCIEDMTAVLITYKDGSKRYLEETRTASNCNGVVNIRIDDADFKNELKTKLIHGVVIRTIKEPMAWIFDKQESAKIRENFICLFKK